MIDQRHPIYHACQEALNNAYAPYSKFRVAAGVLLNNGEFIIGTNVENVSYGLTNCAERTALFYTYSLGYRQSDINCLVIVCAQNRPITPCGACRQVISELMSPQSLIYMISDSDIVKATVRDLLPSPFVLEVNNEQ